MARKPIPIATKIKTAEEKVAKTKEKYDKAVEELEALKTQAFEEEKTEFFEAVKASGKSMEEIMNLISADEEE